MTVMAPLPVWLNGRLLPAGQARIDPADRGFLLGDGLFETMRVSSGHVMHFDRHMRRLAEGATILMLPVPDRARLAAAVDEMLAACALGAGSLRLTCTRGPGPRGLLPRPRSPRPFWSRHRPRSRRRGRSGWSHPRTAVMRIACFRA